jgi:DNA-3-methyladenine glycosylase II
MSAAPAKPPAPAKPDQTLRPALEALASADPLFAEAYERCGLPPERGHPPGFDGLVRIIAAQQVSAGAARAIVARLAERFPALTPEAALSAGPEGLRACGLSRPKVAYCLGLAEASQTGALDFAALERMEDEEAISALVSVKGVGRWTAEVYLLFSLKRPDVFPGGDLALQAGVQRLLNLTERPGPEAAAEVAAARWRPHRSAAARFLWHYYHHEAGF